MRLSSRTMRTLRLYFLSFVVVATVMVACRKEPIASAPSSADVQLKNGADCAVGVSIECGMLAFVDRTHFDEVYQCLHLRHEAYLDWFEDQYGSLSEDAYNDMADQLGFVDEQTLIQFEDALVFSSYRKYIADLEEAWLAGGGDPEFGPGASDLFDDEVLATLVNENGAVLIGGIVHYTAPDGQETDFCSCELYEQYMANPNSVDLGDPCVVQPKTKYCSDYLTLPCYCCRSEQVEKGGIEFDDNKKVTWTLSFKYQSATWFSQNGTRAIAKIRGWRYKNGRWKARRMRMEANSTGHYWDRSCLVDNRFYSRVVQKKRKTVKAKALLGSAYDLDPIKTFKTGKAKGHWRFYYNGSDFNEQYSDSLEFVPDPPCQ